MLFANIITDITHSTFVLNVLHNLFKPLLLFFYMGFLIPILRVKFEFPKAVYQGLTIYLLLAIGWKGGEELAALGSKTLLQALGFMAVGFVTNTIIGITAYWILRMGTKLRKVDAATVGGYYGSDSAGTFVTCTGVLASAGIAYAAYMPVMLAVMEIPGCLVALFLVSRFRANGMDADGNCPGEPGYAGVERTLAEHDQVLVTTAGTEEISNEAVESAVKAHAGAVIRSPRRHQGGGYDSNDGRSREEGEAFEARMALEESGNNDADGLPKPKKKHQGIDLEVLHEVFFNPGIFLLFAGIVIGYLARSRERKSMPRMTRCSLDCSTACCACSCSKWVSRLHNVWVT